MGSTLTRDEQRNLRYFPPSPANGWQLIENFACNKCGGPAYHHPKDRHCWGCARCHFETWSVSLFFNPMTAMLITLPTAKIESALPGVHAIKFRSAQQPLTVQGVQSGIPYLVAGHVRQDAFWATWIARLDGPVHGGRIRPKHLSIVWQVGNTVPSLEKFEDSRRERWNIDFCRLPELG